MRWPWQSRAAPPLTERRSSYTSAVLDALLAGVAGNVATPAATAALEACAALFSHAFASAAVTPDTPATRAVTPDLLALISRDLIRRGESLHDIVVDAAGVRLIAAGGWDVRGGVTEPEWMYRLDRYGPSGSLSFIRPSAAVLHFRYAVDPARPWRGVAPLAWARETGKLAGSLESRIGEEMTGPVGTLLPVPGAALPGDEPATDADDPLAELRTAIRDLKGKAMLVETTAAGFGEGPDAAPRHDWRPQRVGPSVPESAIALRRDVAVTVAAACGVPPPLIAERAEGSGQREAWRRFLHGAVQPLARQVETELRRKLEVPDLALSFDSLFASDLAGRARAFQSMVNGGLDIAAAAGLAGLMERED